MKLPLFLNSRLVSGLTTFLAAAIGLTIALALATARRRWQQIVLVLVIVALAWPSFLITNVWLDLLGQNGLLRPWLPLSIYSLGGAVTLLALQWWPLTTLLTFAAWSRLEASQIEADPLLRGGKLVRWLLWPMAQGAIGQAAALTFVLALNNFAIPVILQVPVFPEELWLSFTTRLNDAGAWAAAWPMVGAAVVVVLALRCARTVWPVMDGAVPASALRRQLGPTWGRASGGLE